MFDLFTIENFGNLIVLLVLQAVLGFDNLLYISIESQRAPVAHQKAVRFLGHHYRRGAQGCFAFCNDPSDRSAWRTLLYFQLVWSVRGRCEFCHMRVRARRCIFDVHSG